MRRSIWPFKGMFELAFPRGLTALRLTKKFGLCFVTMLVGVHFSSVHAEHVTPPSMAEPHRELWNSIGLHFEFTKEHVEILVTFNRDGALHITDVVIQQGAKTYKISGQELAFAKYPEPGHISVTFVPEGEYGIVIVELPYYPSDALGPDNAKFASIVVRNMSTHKIEKPGN